MNRMTEVDLAAWNGMIEGDLDPLADALDIDGGYLHPVLQRWLLKLIRGGFNEVDYRIMLVKHPALTRVSDGAQHRRRESTKQTAVALVMAKHGGMEDGQYEAAITATMAETGLSRATIAKYWSAKKKLIEFSKAHNII